MSTLLSCFQDCSYWNGFNSSLDLQFLWPFLYIFFSFLQNALTIIGTLVTLMLHNFFNSLLRSKYLFSFSHFTFWSTEIMKSTVWLVFLFFFIIWLSILDWMFSLKFKVLEIFFILWDSNLCPIKLILAMFLGELSAFAYVVACLISISTKFAFAFLSCQFKFSYNSALFFFLDSLFIIMSVFISFIFSLFMIDYYFLKDAYHL